MSWSRRRSLLVACLVLAGCGFTPVYGPQGVARGLEGQIFVDEPSDSSGFALVRRLEERLGHASDSARYHLSASIQIGNEGVGVTPEQTISRYNLLGRVRYTLTDRTTSVAVASGSVENFTAYSATSTTVATTAARRDAEERLMTTLADQIVARLVATAGDWRK